MTVSIWTDAFLDLPLEESLRRIAECGWRTVELAGIHWEPLLKHPNPDSELRRMRKLSSELGITIKQMHGVCYDVCGEKKARESGLEIAIKTIEWGAELGVESYVFHPGSRPWEQSEEALRTVQEMNVEAISEMSEAGKKVGVKIALENVVDARGGGRNFGSNPHELIWLAKNTDPENVGVCWDTGHAHLQGLKQAECIEYLSDFLIATHIADNDTSRDEHLLPYEGTIEWEPIIRALRKIDYEGLFNLEISGGVHRIPLDFRELKVRYACKLVEAMLNHIR